MNCGGRARVVAGARWESAQAGCIRPANRKVNHRHQAVVMQRPSGLQIGAKPVYAVIQRAH